MGPLGNGSKCSTRERVRENREVRRGSGGVGVVGGVAGVAGVAGCHTVSCRSCGHRPSAAGCPPCLHSTLRPVVRGVDPCGECGAVCGPLTATPGVPRPVVEEWAGRGEGKYGTGESGIPGGAGRRAGIQEGHARRRGAGRADEVRGAHRTEAVDPACAGRLITPMSSRLHLFGPSWRPENVLTCVFVPLWRNR